MASQEPQGDIRNRYAEKTQEGTSAASRNPIGPVHAEETYRQRRNDDSPLERFGNWSLKVIGLAAAIVFGIWAPLSYNVTLEGNRGNDAASSSMLTAAVVAYSGAEAAAATQRAMLDDLNSRIGAIGQLWLVDFCVGQTVSIPYLETRLRRSNAKQSVAGCDTFTSSIDLPSLVSYLALATATSSSTSAGNSATSSRSSSRSGLPTASNLPYGLGNPGGKPGEGGSTKLSVPAILGIVFGALSGLGLLAGAAFLLLRKRRERPASVVS